MAEAVIGALRVNLAVNTAEFQTGLVQAEGALARFGRAAKFTGGFIKGFLGAALGAVLVSAARASTRELAKSAVKTQVFQEKLEQAKRAADDFSDSMAILAGPLLEKAAKNMELVAFAAGAIGGAKVGGALGFLLGGPGGAAVGGAIGLFTGSLLAFAAASKVAEKEGTKLSELNFDSFKEELAVVGSLTALRLARDAAAEAQRLQTEAAKEAAVAQQAEIDRVIAHQEALEGLKLSLIESTQGPLEQYRAKLVEIALAQDGTVEAAEAGARANVAAAATLANTYLGAAGAVTGALATIFKDNKAFAIANAVVNTAEAITAAIKNPPGPPWSFAYAAAAAASGAAQIAAIASAKPGSSSKPSASKGGGGGASTGGGGGGRGSGPSQAVTINLQGQGGFTRDQVRNLAEQLNGLVADGATIRTA